MSADVFPFPARRRISGSQLGEAQSLRRGDSGDLAGSRTYRPGDDPRAIDRAGSARLSAARGSDAFVVREFYAEDTPVAVMVCDRAPAFGSPVPPGVPFLDKRRALNTLAELICDSAEAARTRVGFLDGDLFLPPGARGARELLFERLAQPLPPRRPVPSEPLGERRRHLPAGALVFFCSDFAAGQPDDGIWPLVHEGGWELVPVVIQDPVWEQSFPLDAAGLVLADAGASARITRADAGRLRDEHRQRLERIAAWSSAQGFEAVVPAGYSRAELLAAFLTWARVLQPRRAAS